MRALILLLGFLSHSAFASTQKGPDFNCATEFPTTTYIVSSNNSKIEPKTTLKMINHHGGNYIPVHTGTVLASDLNYLQEKAALLKKLGEWFFNHF